MKLKALTAVLCLAAWPAFAHEIEKGPHGGRIVDTGQGHVELVVNGTNVDVYLTGKSDKAVAAAGYKGVAILLVGGKPQRIVLEPTADNRLTGKASAAIAGAPRGAVRLTGPDGTTSQAKFE
jgi:hypothetical protein